MTTVNTHRNRQSVTSTDSSESNQQQLPGNNRERERYTEDDRRWRHEEREGDTPTGAGASCVCIHSMKLRYWMVVCTAARAELRGQRAAKAERGVKPRVKLLNDFPASRNPRSWLKPHAPCGKFIGFAHYVFIFQLLPPLWPSSVAHAEREGEEGREKCVCVCVCVYAYVRACMCVCVCNCLLSCFSVLCCWLHLMIKCSSYSNYRLKSDKRSNKENSSSIPWIQVII